ncbi:alpha/beta-hydrolase [Phellopilus nigrolimitatus]|nr:alpha/beta-hydrolase [Phellopilus nigrolimitatus]
MAVAPPDVDSESDSACYSESDADTREDLMPARADPACLTAHDGGEHAPDASTEPSVALQHSALHTEFIGVRHPVSTSGAEVHQFRGIKYASVPLRFRRSILFESFSGATDATKYGPISPQIKNRWLESRLYGLPRDIIPIPSHVPPESEFECLNLTVTTPGPACRVKHGPLPVMVWIHGGGNVTGAGTDWIWDAGALVRKSVQIGRPVVVVAINFRLGLFGFGASELLREDNAAAGERGVGNYGLHDQRTALKWIRKYISGFGGDPHCVTLFGSSWGAADIHAHLLSAANHADVTAAPDQEGPLFHRAILQSGALVPSSSVVQDVHSAGHHLGRIMSALHVTTIEQLRAVSASKLVAVTGERVRPVDDAVFLRPDWRTLALPSSNSPDAPKRWRQDVIIGDVACESVLWAAPARLWAADAVSRRARAIVQSVRRADALMRAYDIVDAPGSPARDAPPALPDSALDDDDESGSSGSDPDEGECELAERVMELMNDVAFAWPVDVAARCAADSAFVFEEQPPPCVSGDGYLSTVSESDSSTSASLNSSVASLGLKRPQATRPANAPYVYRYVFDQASPYTSSPHHGVDLLYLFGNVPFPTDPDLSPEENEEVNWDRVKVRSEVQERWLAFANGERPWDALTPQPPAGVANMSDRGIFATPMLSPVSSFSYNPHGLAPSPGTASPASSSSRASSFSSAFSGTQNPFLHTPHAHAHPPHAAAHHPHHHHLHAHHLNGGGHGSGHGQLYGPAQPAPISISAADKVFVFGPEGETGARSARIFAGRRRVHAWREALAPLGLATAQKVGLELGNGPPVPGMPRF